MKKLFLTLWYYYCDILDPLSIIDLISILPYFVELIIETVFNGNVPVGWIAVVRIFRLFRVFRLFKLGRFLTGIQVGLWIVNEYLFVDI